MCSIVIVNHHHKAFPLVIAANRDEDFNRPSSVVQSLSNDPHLIIGGRDELKGGIWLGVNQHSLFAAITNQGDTNPKLASRGIFVMEALKCKTIEELIAFVEETNPSKYNKFNLVFGNSKVVFLAHSYLLHSMVIRELSPGIHLVNSNMVFTGEDTKKQYIHNRLDNIIDTAWLDYYKALKKILASTEYGMKLKPRKDKATGKLGYGTVSSSILAFADDGLARYKFYDRTAVRPKKKDRKEGEALQPRYKDYIDLLRGNSGIASEEGEEKDDESEETATQDIKDIKLKFSKMMTTGMKPYRFDGWNNGEM